MDKYHLTKKGNQWRLKKEGAERATKASHTKAEAIQHMQEFMSNRVASVKIHKQTGEFQEERTYQRGDDPRSSKG